MFKDAAIYPKDGTDATKTVLIGGVLTLLSFLLVPLFLLVGYTVRVVRAVAGGDETLPVFDEWGDMLVDGVKGFAITLAYFPFAAVAAPVGPGRAPTLVVLGGLAAMPVALVVWYVATAGFVNFAVTGRVRAAFAFDDLRSVLTSGGFATGWLVGLAVLVVGSVVGGIVGAIPILGLVSAFVTFYTTSRCRTATPAASRTPPGRPGARDAGGRPRRLIPPAAPISNEGAWSRGLQNRCRRISRTNLHVRTAGSMSGRRLSSPPLGSARPEGRRQRTGGF